MGVVGNIGEPVGKLGRVGVPITDTAKPTCIEAEHLQAQLPRTVDHPHGKGFIHLHAATPAVVDGEGIMRILPGIGVAKHNAHPLAKLVARTVEAACEGAQKSGRCLKRIVFGEPCAEWARVGIKPEYALKLITLALQMNLGAAAELDAGKPAIAGTGARVNKVRWNDLARLPLHRPRVGAGESCPLVAVVDW